MIKWIVAFAVFGVSINAIPLLYWGGEIENTPRRDDLNSADGVQSDSPNYDLFYNLPFGVDVMLDENNKTITDVNGNNTVTVDDNSFNWVEKSNTSQEANVTFDKPVVVSRDDAISEPIVDLLETIPPIIDVLNQNISTGSSENLTSSDFTIPNVDYSTANGSQKDEYSTTPTAPEGVHLKNTSEPDKILHLSTPTSGNWSNPAMNSIDYSTPLHNTVTHQMSTPAQTLHSTNLPDESANSSADNEIALELSGVVSLTEASIYLNNGELESSRDYTEVSTTGNRNEFANVYSKYMPSKFYTVSYPSSVRGSTKTATQPDEDGSTQTPSNEQVNSDTSATNGIHNDGFEQFFNQYIPSNINVPSYSFPNRDETAKTETQPDVQYGSTQAPNKGQVSNNETVAVDVNIGIENPSADSEPISFESHNEHPKIVPPIPHPPTVSGPIPDESHHEHPKIVPPIRPHPPAVGVSIPDESHHEHPMIALPIRPHPPAVSEPISDELHHEHPTIVPPIRPHPPSINVPIPDESRNEHPMIAAPIRPHPPAINVPVPDESRHEHPMIAPPIRPHPPAVSEPISDELHHEHPTIVPPIRPHLPSINVPIPDESRHEHPMIAPPIRPHPPAINGPIPDESRHEHPMVVPPIRPHPPAINVPIPVESHHEHPKIVPPIRPHPPAVSEPISHDHPKIVPPIRPHPPSVSEPISHESHHEHPKIVPPIRPHPPAVSEPISQESHHEHPHTAPQIKPTLSNEHTEWNHQNSNTNNHHNVESTQSDDAESSQSNNSQERNSSEDKSKHESDSTNDSKSDDDSDDFTDLSLPTHIYKKSEILKTIKDMIKRYKKEMKDTSSSEELKDSIKSKIDYLKMLKKRFKKANKDVSSSEEIEIPNCLQNGIPIEVCYRLHLS